MSILKKTILLNEKVNSELKRLEYLINLDGKKLKFYGAGKFFDSNARAYNHFFTRDSILSAFLLNDIGFLQNTLQFCIKKQGTKKDPYTAEEPGKIIHEFPGMETKPNLNTEYNSCDSTLLFIIGMAKYFELTKDKKFIEENLKSIKLAFKYVQNHIKGGLFWECPSFSNAKKFSLDATFWRDDGFVQRENRKIFYPAAFLILQAQSVKALRSLIFLQKYFNLGLNERYLRKTISKLLNSISTKFLSEDYICSGIDEKGKIPGLYSDSLHMLYYLEKQDISDSYYKILFDIAEKLKTPFGFRIYAPKQKGYNPESYQHGSIWLIDQALIMNGALQHNMVGIFEIASNSIKALVNLKYPFTELFSYNNKEIKPLGCHLQLWTLGFVRSLYNNLK